MCFVFKTTSNLGLIWVNKIRLICIEENLKCFVAQWASPVAVTITSSLDKAATTSSKNVNKLCAKKELYSLKWITNNKFVIE